MRRDTAERSRRGGDRHPGATRLDAENPNMGSDFQELVRVQGEAGGKLSDAGIKCRPCHQGGHTMEREHFPEEMTFALSQVEHPLSQKEEALWGHGSV